MGIVTMQPPGKRPGRTRLSDEDIAMLAAAIRSGESAGDGEVVEHYQTASQRARSAKTRLQSLGVEAERRVWKVDGGFTWALTPAERS